MQNLIFNIFGGKKSVQIVIVFTLFISLISFWLFWIITCVIDKGFPEGKGENLYKARALIRLLLVEKKSQNFKLSLYVLSNIDKALEKGLVENPFPVDFIEIIDKEGNLIDSWGGELEESLKTDITSGAILDSEGTDSLILPSGDSGISVISALPFSCEGREGWLLVGNNISSSSIEEQISVDDFKVGIYSGSERIVGNYSGLEDLPSEVLKGLKENTISFYIFNIDGLKSDIFFYPLNYKDDVPFTVISGSVPAVDSIRNTFKNTIAFIIITTLFVAFIIIIFLSRTFIAPLEELSRKAKEIVSKGDGGGKGGNKARTSDLTFQLDRLLDDVDKKEEKLRKSSKDLEEQKQHLEIVNIKLKKAQQEVESLDKLKSQFLSNVSHEFRTPVSLIYSFSEILLADNNLTEEQKELVSDIYDSSNRLKETVDNILALPETGDGGKRDNALLSANIPAMVKKVLENFKTEIEKKELAIEYDYAHNLPDSIFCDTDNLEHVLNNLLSNAVKFTGNGGNITIKAEKTSHNPYMIKKVDREESEHFLNISITDTGIGIKPEDQQKIFQKEFWQADASSTREYEGSGLGLIITKRLIEEMDGTVWFYSKEGEGSTFGFVIPIEL